MRFAIAAAGTGGHIFPGLAVAEQLVASGVGREHVLFIGGDRMEADLIPKAGYPLLRIRIHGLERRLSVRNLRIPRLVWDAARIVARELRERRVGAVLCMGSYVTVPVAIAARRTGVPLYIHEQNAGAGLANRLAGRWADRCLVSFPGTRGLAGEVVGYPLRSALTTLDKATVRPEALARYGLESGLDTVGVMGGSLGAGSINEAVTAMSASWNGGPLQIVHLVGARNLAQVSTAGDSPSVTRRVLGFEDRMDLFYGVSDLVVARAGGGLMEAAVHRHSQCPGTRSVRRSTSAGQRPSHGRSRRRRAGGGGWDGLYGRDTGRPAGRPRAPRPDAPGPQLTQQVRVLLPPLPP